MYVLSSGLGTYKKKDISKEDQKIRTWDEELLLEEIPWGKFGRRLRRLGRIRFPCLEREREELRRN